jgi:hypothetical protein
MLICCCKHCLLSRRDVLIQDLVRDLTSGSLQSNDELFSVASFFNIATKDLLDKPQDLKSIFNIRNQISHEMDIDFSQPNRHRRPRAREDMIDFTNTVFKVAKNFIEKTDERLSNS